MVFLSGLVKAIKKRLGYKVYHIYATVEIEKYGDEEHEFYYDSETICIVMIARNEDKATGNIEAEVWDAVKEDYTTEFNDIKIHQIETDAYNL